MKDRLGFKKHVEEVEESLDEEDEEDHDVALADLAPPSFGHMADNKLLEEKLCHLVYEDMKRVNRGGGTISEIPAIKPIGDYNASTEVTTKSAEHRKQDGESDRQYDDEEDSEKDDKKDDPLDKMIDELDL